VAWPTILFFSGLFILVAALGLLWFSVLLSAFADNIPWYLRTRPDNLHPIGVQRLHPAALLPL